MKTKQNTLDANYAAFRANPDAIDGSIQNTTTARAGRAFDWKMQQSGPAVEIAFNYEPIGTTRYLMVVDMAAAKALRDQLDAVLAEQAAKERRARRPRAKTYPVRRSDGRVVNVSIPED